MVRIFGILSAFTAILVFIAGVGMHGVAKSGASQAKIESSEVLAKGIALSISAHTSSLQKTVSKMAASAHVIAAIESNNPKVMAQTASMMESYLPRVMKIRILPANVSELDEMGKPRMGHADLVMSQETLAKQQLPIIQGEGSNRHLAITAAIKKDSKAIGVVLASLKFDFIQSSLNEFQLSHGYIELMQNKAFLANAGNAEGKSGSGQSIAVPLTAWKIYYWPKESSSIVTWSSIIALIFIPALLSGLACVFAYRKLARVLSEDQHSILQIIKDLMSGKNIGSHPVQLGEMKAITTSIIQFKRVLDREETGASIDMRKNETEDFFGEPMGVSFLDENLTDFDEKDDLLTVESEDEQADDTSPAMVDETSAIFRAYDIRGIAGKSLSKEMVFNIGRAVGSDAKEKNINNIVVGRDGRTSGTLLLESLSKGIISTGVNVLDIGLVPSPLVYFVAHHSEGRSGIVVTGSHNPAEYNGIKIVIDGETYSEEKIQLLKQRIDNENYQDGETGTITENNMFINEYIGIISEKIHVERSMKVVIDCGNGAAGVLAPLLLKELGCEVLDLYCDIDGTFPNHHPNPAKPENLTDLITAVQDHKADVGIAFDGDGDRLGVVDSKGKIIWPDRLMMLFAKDVLSLKPGAEILYDVKCSRHLGEQIIKSGGRPLMLRTGHSYMKSKVKETGAALAGEMSGHIIFNNSWFGFDDALYAAARLIEILSSDTRNSDEVFSDFPDSVNTPELEIELSEGENIRVMEELLATAKFDNGTINETDGMRVDFSGGWGLIRASNTMPALSLRFEADNEQSLKEIQSQFKELLVKVKADIVLPF